MVQLKKIYQEALNKLKDNPNAYYYYESGADYEQTLADNEHAYKRYKVYPHLLKKDASDGDIDLTVNAFGTKFKIPIFLAPTAMQKMAHVDGEIGTAKGIIIYNFLVFKFNLYNYNGFYFFFFKLGAHIPRTSLLLNNINSSCSWRLGVQLF